MYQPLKSYFTSCGEKQPRVKRLRALFENPMTELYLLFYQYVLTQFVEFSLFLQREEPFAHLLDEQMNSFLKKLLVKFVQVKEIKRVASLLEIDLINPDVLMDPNDLQIGFLTRQKLRLYESSGDISQHQRKVFLDAVMQFYLDTAMYVIKSFPFNDPLLMHAEFINFEKRLDASFTDATYFVEKFPSVLRFSASEMDKLQEEFNEYQLMEELPEDVYNAAKIVQETKDSTAKEYLRMDVVWGIHISKKLPKLFQVAEVVLLIPHSNAEEERVFSMVRKNKTDFRASLATDGSLSSILTVKLNNREPSHTFEPSTCLIER